METPPTKAQFQEHLARAWQDFWDYLRALSPEQLTTPTDAAGWTVKDHIVHVAAWEHGIVALLRQENRAAAMGIDDTIFAQDVDAINAVIRERYQSLSIDAAFAKLAETHAHFLTEFAKLSDADLQKPYRAYAPQSDRTDAVVWVLMADTYEHYDEHLPWIAAIVAHH